MKIEIELTPSDLAMIEAFRRWRRAHPTRPPKSHDLIRAYSEAPRPDLDAAVKVFQRLVLLEVIHHKRNGSCYLAEQFKEAA